MLRRVFNQALGSLFVLGTNRSDDDTTRVREIIHLVAKENKDHHNVVFSIDDPSEPVHTWSAFTKSDRSVDELYANIHKSGEDWFRYNNEPPANYGYHIILEQPDGATAYMTIGSQVKVYDVSIV